MLRSLTFTAVALVLAGPALAEGACSKAPSSEFQPTAALQAKLEAAGQKVRRIKVEGGCYEVYATDQNGNRIVAAYNAKTFEPVADAEAGEN